MMDYAFAFKIIDLSHSLEEGMAGWPGSTSFKEHLRLDHSEGCRCLYYQMDASVGTHMDAPLHFIPNAKTIADIHVEELIAPACVIDIRQHVEKNSDYMLSVSDIEQWEKQYQTIPAKSIVLACTGWSKHWPNMHQYANYDAQKMMHFPGFSAEAAQLLLERNVNGIGIDTFSLDAAISSSYPVHHIMLGAGKFQIENLTHLEKLPPVGASLIALPLKIKNGAEAPARVIALLPK